MIRNLIRGVLFAAVLMMASSCALFRLGDRIRLTEKDSGRTLETEVGDVIEIRLPANPSTGYLWSVKAPEMGVFREVESRYETPEESRGKVGAPVWKIFSFAVVGPGEAGIKMEYRRPWELGEPPKATFDILVRATGTEGLMDRMDRTETPRVGSRGQIEPLR